MSEILNSVKRAFDDTLASVRELSARAPGSPTSQVVMIATVVAGVVYLCLLKRPNLPPGPLAMPVFGNVLALAGQTEPLYVVLSRWADDKYGPVITLQLGPLRCITLNRLDVVHEALVTRGADFAGRPQLCSLGVQTEGFKDIIFADDSKTWQLHRQIAARALKHYMDSELLDQAVHQAVAAITEQMAENKNAFDPHPYMSRLMFQILDLMCFGQNNQSDDSALRKLSETFDALTSDIGNGFVEDAFPFLRHFPTQKFRRFSEHVGWLLDHIYTQIDYHRETLSPDNPRDFVDSLLFAQGETEQVESSESMTLFTDTHVAQTISDIFAGGVDTSRQTLDWALLLLAGHPEEQVLVQEEIDRVTGTRCWPVAADCPHLLYTEATLCEIMRLGSVVPMGIPRKTLRNTRVGGYDVPKNTMVVVNLWSLLHDRRLWDAPEEFRPSRFIDAAAGKLRTDVAGWWPFSAGRRSCLGESVARLELLLVLACILKRFHVTLPEGACFDPTPHTGSMILRVPKPYQIVVRERY